MKKSMLSLVVLIALALLLAGCGDNKDLKDDSGSKTSSNSGTKTCTQTTTDDDGYKTTDTMVITYKNKKVTKVEDTNIMEMDPDYIEFTLSFGQEFAKAFNELKGFEVNYSKDGENKIKMTMNIDFSKIDVDNMKDVLGDLFDDDESFYGDTDITIDDFISKNMEGYTCK